MSQDASARRVRYLLSGLLAAGLAWALVSHSLVAALVRIDPTYALLVRSDDPGALEALADRAIEQSRRVPASGADAARFGFSGSSGRRGASPPAKEGNKSDPSPEPDEETRRLRGDLLRWSSAILAQEPGNARALALLGQLKHEAGEEEPAAALMRASARRSLREPIPQAWLIHEAIETQNWSLAMRHADVLMRMHEQSVGPLTPLIARMAETPATAPLVMDALREAPPWRRPLMAGLFGAIADARTPLEMLLALKETPRPPTVTELRLYLNFLVQRKFFDLAYYTWLQFLPPQELAAVGPLFNGSFELRPSGLPFDWDLPKAGTASVSIARRPDRPSTRALVIDFGHGRVELGETSQLLRLRAGEHHVSGEAFGDVVGPRGVRWRVTCVESRKRIAESLMFMGERAEWTAFSFAVSVPQSDCAAQRLSLELDARTPSERLVSGTIWFDEMSVRREAAATPVPLAPLRDPQSQPRQR